jgi:hypothetical protein
LDSLEARAAALTSAGRVWREFARHPFTAELTVHGRRVLFLMDARYQTSPGPGWSALEVTLER